MKKKFTLTLDEMKILESVYGKQFQNHASYNPRGIEKILELSAQEEKFFANNSFLSPHFSVQTLYKVEGSLTPIKFNHIVRDLIKDNPAFRTNFCNVGSRTLKIIRPPIFFKPEITFHNLTKIDAANLDSELEKILEEIMSVNFDLRNDSLIRFMVCNTGIKEYAVMITTSLLIADRFSSKNFFAELFELPAVIEPKNFSDNFPPVNKDLIHQHLTKLLYNPPPPDTFTLYQELWQIILSKDFSCENPQSDINRPALVFKFKSHYAYGNFMERVGFYVATLQQAA